MATGGKIGTVSNLRTVGYLTLKPDDLNPNGVVLVGDKLVITDGMFNKVRVYRRRDGMLLFSSDRLDARPFGVSHVSKTEFCEDSEFCVAMDNASIAIMAVKNSGQISRGKTVRLRPTFGYCHGVGLWNDTIVVSGVKDMTICWCVVSLKDRRPDKLHKICGGKLSYLTVKHDMVYISCYADSHDDRGVYGFNLLSPRQPPYTYKDEELSWPLGITVDDIGHVFVCAWESSIHHLTEKCQLVAIYKDDIPRDPVAIFWDSGVLYVTSYGSNVITMYKTPQQGPAIPANDVIKVDRTDQIEKRQLFLGEANASEQDIVSQRQEAMISQLIPIIIVDPVEQVTQTLSEAGTGIPVEILNMDDRSIQLFEKALKDGKEKVYSIRVMVIGHQGVGKTTLIKRLLGKNVNILERQSTEGIDVHLHCCDVSLSSHEWTLRTKESEQDYRLQRLAKVLIEKQVRSEAADDKQDVSSHEVEITDISTQGLDAEEPDIVSPHPDLQKTSQQVRSKTADEKQVVIPQEGEVTDISGLDYVAEEPSIVSPHTDLFKTSQHAGSPGILRNLPKSNANAMVMSEPGETVSSESRMKDTNREILQLLQKNADKIKHDLGKYAPLTIWDFAGQYAFYTTHQMFLSRRAIYLLVSDLSGRIDDLVDDECYFDMKGKMKCRVLELVEVWMNSVHSCAPPDNEIMNSEFIPPPVILVGTHADAIQQAGKEEQMTRVPDAASSSSHSKKQRKLVKLFKSIFSKKGMEASKVESQIQAGAKKTLDETETKDYRHEICENYFREIRSHLKDKPSRFHLVEEEFDIDNTVVDNNLEGLKRKIVEVASQQPYWGEEIPAMWLPLEQVLMNLRAEGHKVIHRSLLENINQAGGVQISTDELDLFLRFQHEIGTILYFSTELLKEKIVLEPQWMINALKSLITVEEMFVLRHAPSVSTMWHEFRNGKLYLELIDALWTKDNNADLHDNKDHILLLMEQLNIIAKPKLYIDDESEIKEVNYYFAPCMLHVEPPREVIFPEPHEQMESSSVMCYVFTGKFLPAPIFHRLLAACIVRWPLATNKTKTTLEKQIFCGCGVFQIDDYHKLTLHFSAFIIFMRVTRQGIIDKTPSSKLCIEAKEFIAKVLNKIIGYLGHTLMFEEFIQCPEYSDGSVDINSLIPVAKLKENVEVRCNFHDNIIESNKILKFWIEAQRNIHSVDETCVSTSNQTMPEECQKPIQERALPPRKKYHAFFSYASPDIQWVKEIVKKLETEHGFICCEYDRDNTPGTQLLTFVEESIINAYKIVLVMTREAFQSEFVKHEIQMAMNHGFTERRKCIVPVLVEDCDIPDYLKVLNYVDARDEKKSSIWWPKLLTELDYRGD